MTTARSIITQAYRALGIAAAEQPLSADMVESGLTTLNAMLDSWSLERLVIYTTPPLLIPLVAGQGSMTCGPGGQVAIPRPLRLDQEAWIRDPTQPAQPGWPVTVLTRQEWRSLAHPQQTGPRPYGVYYAPDVPLGVLYVTPVPLTAWDLTVYPWQVLRRFASFDEEVPLPEGYERALWAGLALESAPAYGVEPSPLVAGILSEAKNNLKRVNVEVPLLGIDPGLSNWRGVPADTLAGWWR